MVLCQGCTRNICTFYVELFVNKLLPLKPYKSSWFSVAAPHVPLQEEDLPLCKEHSLASVPSSCSCVPWTVLLSIAAVMSLAGGICVLSCSHHIVKSKISVSVAYWEIKSFLLHLQHHNSDASYSSKPPAITVVLSISHLVCKRCHFLLSDTAIKCCSRFPPFCTR